MESTPDLPEAEAPARPADLRIAYVPGVTLSKWGGTWKTRHPRALTSFALGEEADQTAVLREGRADVSFVRLPIERGEDLFAIPLYREVPMAVLPKEHAATAFAELTLAELAAEHLIQDPADVPGWAEAGREMIEGTRRDLPAPASVPDGLELVAAGVGFMVLPQSIARLHARKDVVQRPLTDLEPTRIAIAWRAEGDAEDLAERVEEFIGIVRGRTANSSRGRAEEPAPAVAKKPRPEPQKKKPSGTFVRHTRKPSAKKRGRR